jgi:putative transcriptional regulator
VPGIHRAVPQLRHWSGAEHAVHRVLFHGAGLDRSPAQVARDSRLGAAGRPAVVARSAASLRPRGDGFTMNFVNRVVALTLAFLASVLTWPAQAQDDQAVFLVAHPMFRDLDYRQTVLLAAPVPAGGHVGVILNRPTRRSLGSLFPEHEPSKKVVEPVYYGGPFSRGALVALVKTDATPGSGSLPMMKHLYMAFRANIIDQIIESTPNEARYYVGHILWRPGELRHEIDRGLWTVLDADLDVVFRKDTEGLWEELLQQSRRIRAGAPAPYAAAFAGAFSNTVLPPR